LIGERSLNAAGGRFLFERASRYPLCLTKRGQSHTFDIRAVSFVSAIVYRLYAASTVDL
jgi:hypothetical protein